MRTILLSEDMSNQYEIMRSNRVKGQRINSNIPLGNRTLLWATFNKRPELTKQMLVPSVCVCLCSCVSEWEVVLGTIGRGFGGGERPS